MSVPADPSIAIAALPGDPLRRLQALRELRARAVTLDLALPGLRPRELDRSARRGLAAALRQAELRLAGVDLPIPPEHFADPATQDRAIAAVAAAADFLADLAPLTDADLVIALTFPAAETAVATESANAAADHARAAGVTLANLARPAAIPASGWHSAVDLAREIDAGASPLKAITSADSLAMVRLTDADHVARRALGDGRLDLAQTHAVLSVAAPDAVLVIDPRGLHDPLAGAREGLLAWARAATLFPRP